MGRRGLYFFARSFASHSVRFFMKPKNIVSVYGPLAAAVLLLAPIAPPARAQDAGEPASATGPAADSAPASQPAPATPAQAAAPTPAAAPAAAPAPTTAAEAPPAVSEKEAQAAEAQFEEGRKLFFQGEYAKAIEKLKAAADANAAKTSYRLLLAKAHRHAHQPDQAIAMLEDVLRANPRHVEAGVELAELLSPSRQPDRVIGVLSPLLTYRHDYPLYHLLAEAYYQKEDLVQARQHYAEAVKLNPASGDDYYQLGNIDLAQKRFAKAAENYEQAGRLGVSSGVYHFKLASVYFNLHHNLGRVETAEVIGGQPGQIKNDRYLIESVPGQKDQFYVALPRSAIFQVAKAQSLGIDIFDVHFLEANIWLAAQRFDKASAIYSRLEEKVQKADAGLFWFSWAQAALGQGDFDNYLARLEKAIAADPEVYKPTLADAYLTVAERHNQQGDNARYLEFLGKAVQINPLSARLHLALGDAHWLSGQREQAVAQYRLVLELEPEHGDRARLLNRIKEAS